MLTFFSYQSATKEAQRIADVLNRPVYVVHNSSRVRYALREFPVATGSALWMEGWRDLLAKYPTDETCRIEVVNGFYVRVDNLPSDRL